MARLVYKVNKEERGNSAQARNRVETNRSFAAKESKKKGIS